MLQNPADMAYSGFTSARGETGEGVMEWLLITNVKPNPGQPRKVFDQEKLRELAQSIQSSGILQPILVRPMGTHFEIISGERRFQAARLAGLDKIPALIRRVDDQKAMVAALIENIQREDLNPVEEATALNEILETQNLTHDELALALGRSRSALTNRLRILKLPRSVQDLISTGSISAGHAKMLAGLDSPEEIDLWVRKILQEHLSVYETEKQMSHTKQDLASQKKGRNKKQLHMDIHQRMVEEKLRESLGAKVKIRRGKKRGVIEIEFYDTEDLQRVLDTLLPQGF